MDRFRDFFDNALLRARPPGGDPTATSFAIPQLQPMPFPIPQPMPFTPQLPSTLGGMGGFGSTPYASLGPPLSVLGRKGQAAAGADLGPSLNQIQQQKKTGVATTPGSGAAGGSASAVAASSPPPAHTGATPVGTRATVLRWLPQVTEVARKYDVPPEMVLAIMHNESGGDPKAQSPYNPDQGYARGLLQVMPFHFQQGEDPFDVATNLDKGVKFMSAMYHQYGKDPDKTMAAYFGGPGAIDANGNIRTNLRDVNTSIGNYVNNKFRPAYAAYQQYMQGLSTSGLREQSVQQGGQWDHLVPGGQGKVERGGTHGGQPAIDIFAPAGTPILAPADGVNAPGTYSLGGNAATLQGADGRWYYFAHAQAPMRGGQVRKGDVIGYVGNTGNARNTKSHLHYAVATDPTAFDRFNGSGDVDPY